MKNTIKAIPIIISAAAFCAVVLVGPNASANMITGSIGFGASGVTINSTKLSTASDFSVSNPFTTVETGTYSTVPMFTSVSFSGFVFNPPVSSVIPLWTFDVGPVGDVVVYSFDATTVKSSFNSSLDEWDIGGLGMAMATGYSATPGTWNVNLSQSGSSFVFDSSAAAKVVSVSDGGLTLGSLGGAFLCLGALARKNRG
jgi:hypothetical protein